MATNRLELIPNGVDQLIQKFVAHPTYRLRTEEVWAEEVWDEPDRPKCIKERYIHIEFVTGEITITISIGGFVCYLVNGQEQESLFRVYGETEFKEACQEKKPDVSCVILYPNSKENQLQITTRAEGIELESFRSGISGYTKVPRFCSLGVPYAMQEFIFEIIEVAKTIHQRRYN